VHYFIESASLKGLAPGSRVDLELDSEAELARLRLHEGAEMRVFGGEAILQEARMGTAETLAEAAQKAVAAAKGQA